MVCVPEGVVAEIKAVSDDPASGAIDTCDWLRRVAVVVPDGIKAWDLGCGESEVIAHALVSPGFRPLLDDSEGKACSLAFGLKPLGTGGLLVYAKRLGLLDSVGDVLDDMRGRGLWISDQVFNAILQQAGEKKINNGTGSVKS
jgi:predicted nucleic acid-binding protein